MYFRNFSRGLAIVNPTAAAMTVNLDAAYVYEDCYGAAVQAAGVQMGNQTGLVLLRAKPD